MKYIPELDGLRAIAIALVLLSHFLPQTPTLELANLGGFGVRLFFVLSGYLITHVLLNLRAEGMPLKAAAAQFYWKRFLRLSPPYYAAIAFCLVIGIANMREDFVWHTLYLSNVMVALRREWGEVGHFWSLSVEEQFYLIWFFVVMLLSFRNLLWAIGFGIAASVAYRLVTVLMGLDYFPRILLPGVTDFLLFGALLAYLQARHITVFEKIAKTLLNPFVFALLAAATVTVNFSTPSYTKSMIQPFVWLLTFGSILLFAALPARSRYSAWLRAGLLVHVGKISYGIYVYHMIIPPALRKLTPEFEAALYMHWIFPLVVHTALALIVAEASWHLMEKPLKRYRTAADSYFRSATA